MHYAEIQIEQRHFYQAKQSLLKAYSVHQDNPEIWFALYQAPVSLEDELKKTLKFKLTQYAQEHPDQEISIKFTASLNVATEPK